MSKYGIYIALLVALIWFAHSIAPLLDKWSEPPKAQQVVKRIQT